MAKITWANDGEAGEDGKFRVNIDCEDGAGVQVFEGADHKELCDKLVMAQLNATTKIRELTRNARVEPAAAAGDTRPAPISEDERFKLVNELQDPATAPEAVTRLVEGATGVAFTKLAEKAAEEERAERNRKAVEEAEAFTAETPEYHVTEHNGRLLCQYIIARNGALTKHNFSIAFAELSKSGLLEPKPAGQSTNEGAPAAASQPEGGAPGGLPAATTRPRGVIQSTGIRSGDSTGATGTGKPASKYTIAEIEAMPKAVYEEKLRGERGFADAVNALYAKQR